MIEITGLIIYQFMQISVIAVILALIYMLVKSRYILSLKVIKRPKNENWKAATKKKVITKKKVVMKKKVIKK